MDYTVIRYRGRCLFCSGFRLPYFIPLYLILLYFVFLYFILLYFLFRRSVFYVYTHGPLLLIHLFILAETYIFQIINHVILRHLHTVILVRCQMEQPYQDSKSCATCTHPQDSISHAIYLITQSRTDKSGYDKQSHTYLLQSAQRVKS